MKIQYTRKLLAHLLVFEVFLPSHVCSSGIVFECDERNLPLHPICFSSLLLSALPYHLASYLPLTWIFPSSLSLFTPLFIFLLGTFCLSFLVLIYFVQLLLRTFLTLGYVVFSPAVVETRQVNSPGRCCCAVLQSHMIYGLAGYAESHFHSLI